MFMFPSWKYDGKEVKKKRWYRNPWIRMLAGLFLATISGMLASLVFSYFNAPEFVNLFLSSFVGAFIGSYFWHTSDRAGH